MIENSIFNLRGVVDIHIHSGPCLFHRLFDDTELAQDAAAAGLEAVVIKNHFESTVGRAGRVSLQVPQIKVFGGIVLNTWVGGFNPVVVETQILRGAKVVWMPTTTAANHVRTFGGGTYTSGEKISGPLPIRWSPRLSPGDGLSVLDGSELRGEVKEIVEIVAEHDVALGTSHISKQEMFALIQYASKVGARKVLVTHPYWTLPGLTLPELKELVNLGAFAELVAICHIMPEPVPIALAKQTVDELGAERIVISSDTGAAMFPKTTEGLRLMGQWLYQQGVSESQLRTMMIDTPKWLLGI